LGLSGAATASIFHRIYLAVSLALIRYNPPPTKVLARRLLLLAELRESLGQLESERDELQRQLKEFEKRFRPAVGDRYDRLEELREQIRRAWAEVSRARNGSLKPTEDSLPDEIPQQAFKPEDELKILFRALARKIHPDLADDYDDRRHRHEFMSEATRAYRAGDHRRLQWLLEHWEAAPSRTHGVDQETRLERTSQQIAWVRYRIREVNAEIAECGASSTMRLMEQSSKARSGGRNLVVEMRNQVLKEIKEAERDLQKVHRVLGDFDEETVRIIRANAGLDE
jgi:hypothetical protein